MTLLLVLDPQNSDATFGVAEEAELWVVPSAYPMEHTGAAIEEGVVTARVKLSELVEAARALVTATDVAWLDTPEISPHRKKLKRMLDVLDGHDWLT